MKILNKSLLLLILNISISTYVHSNPLDTSALETNENPSLYTKFIGFISNSDKISSQKPEIILNKYNPQDPNVVQGLVIDNRQDYIYTMTSLGKPEKSIITRYKYKADGTLLPDIAQPETNIIGHQGITLDPLTGTIWTTAGNGIKNKGWYIVGFKFNDPSSLNNPIIKQVFDKDYKNYTPAMPSISPSGQYIVVAGHNIKNNSSVIRVFDFRNLINNSGLSKPIYEWSIDKSLFKNNFFFQALTTDGNYVYLLGGGENKLNKRIYVYNLKGEIIQKLENVNIGKPSFTNNNNIRWEPEGLSIDSKNNNLLIMYESNDNSHKYAEIFKTPIKTNENN